MKRECGIFRNKAKQAKKRLASGFWASEKQVREKSLKTALNHGAGKQEALNVYINHLKSQMHIADHDPADEQLYRRICNILNTTSGISPLAQVLDREHMRTLGDAERERYVFALSAKVQKCISRWEQEQLLSASAF